MSDSISLLDHLSVRELQAYGALCLARFCKAGGIQHQAVDELLVHLIGLLSAESLPDWERAGTRFRLTGRGDAIPEDVLEAVPIPLQADFQKIVERAVEIGITDMYGKLTDKPKECAQSCRDILTKCGFGLPDIGAAKVHAGPPTHSWGAPATTDECKRVIQACKGTPIA